MIYGRSMVKAILQEYVRDASFRPEYFLSILVATNQPEDFASLK